MTEVAVAVVAGALANKPLNGGEAWVRLSWLLGLRRLGYDGHLVERLPGSACVDRAGAQATFDDSLNRVHFDRVVDDFGLAGRATLLDEKGVTMRGLAIDQVRELVAEAEVVFNLSGHLPPDLLPAGRGTRVYVDLDPGFTQVWHADPRLGFRLAGHDRHVTVGLNLANGRAALPPTGIEWVPTLPPVLLDEWPAQPLPTTRPFRFTTVAGWRSPYGPLRLGGRTLRLKHHEFRRAAGLPPLVAEASFELALDIHDDDAGDRAELERHGWSIVDPHGAGGDPAAYREYLRGSGAEFSVANGVYVATRCGWFSDRTAAYLATGRPALVQDTGIADLPLGEGLITFSNLRQAADGARRIVRDPEREGRAARALAEERLDSDLVLARLLAAIGVGG